MKTPKRSRETLTEERPSKRKKEEPLDQEILKLYKSLQVTEQEITKIVNVHKFVTGTVKNMRIDGVQLFPYGSFVTDLMVKGHHDVDLGIYAPKNISATAFRNAFSSSMVSKFQTFSSKGVLNVQFHHNPTNLDCDLIMTTNKSKITEVEDTNTMVNAYEDIETCRIIIYILKLWMKRRKLSNEDSGGTTFNATGLIYMIIHYMQQIGVVPLWNPQECALVTRNFTAQDKSLKRILRGFFRYYKKFDSYQSVVSITRIEIHSRRKYPDIYYNEKCALAIESIGTSVNVTKSMTVKGWALILEEMKIASDLLKEGNLDEVFIPRIVKPKTKKKKNFKKLLHSSKDKKDTMGRFEALGKKWKN